MADINILLSILIVLIIHGTLITSDTTFIEESRRVKLSLPDGIPVGGPDSNNQLGLKQSMLHVLKCKLLNRVQKNACLKSNSQKENLNKETQKIQDLDTRVYLQPSSKLTGDDNMVGLILLKDYPFRENSQFDDVRQLDNQLQLHKTDTMEWVPLNLNGSNRDDTGEILEGHIDQGRQTSVRKLKVQAGSVAKPLKKKRKCEEYEKWVGGCKMCVCRNSEWDCDTLTSCMVSTGASKLKHNNLPAIGSRCKVDGILHKTTVCKVCVCLNEEFTCLTDEACGKWNKRQKLSGASKHIRSNPLHPRGGGRSGRRRELPVQMRAAERGGV